MPTFFDPSHASITSDKEKCLQLLQDGEIKQIPTAIKGRRSKDEKVYTSRSCQ